MGYDKTFTAEELNRHYYTKFPVLVPLREKIDQAVAAIVECYQNGGTVFCCGNGGSSADSAHIVGELLKGFLARRPLSAEEKEAFRRHGDLGAMMAEKMQGSLAAVDLTTQQSILTAVANDNDPLTMYAQQIWGLGKKGDVLIGLSTSGNAKNVLCTGIAAAEKGITTIAMTGEGGGAMGQHFDILINAPSSWTPEVQEYHIAIYHLICGLVEAAFFA